MHTDGVQGSQTPTFDGKSLPVFVVKLMVVKLLDFATVFLFGVNSLSKSTIVIHLTICIYTCHQTHLSMVTSEQV